MNHVEGVLVWCIFWWQTGILLQHLGGGFKKEKLPIELAFKSLEARTVQLSRVEHVIPPHFDDKSSQRAIAKVCDLFVLSPSAKPAR